ncbi:MAG: T9SS type A sorting domain-containing protein, partial [Bacteroidota bacterium]
EIRDYNYKIQDSLFNSYEQNTILWKEQSNDQVEESIKLWMNEIHLWAKSKYDSLLIILDVDEDNPSSNQSFGLLQNYPNPFNPTTTIKYTIPNVASSFSSSVKLMVYDILGKEITTLVNENKQPGDYEITFNANTLSSGIYYYQLRSENYAESRKMVYVK